MKYRTLLPHLNGKNCLTDGGLETVLIFQEGIDLPSFASFVLLDRDDGSDILQRYFDPYAKVARDHALGLLLESPTWRANPDWATQLGYDQRQLDCFNARAIAEMERVRSEHEADDSPMPISGCVGTRGDGYAPASMMSPEESAQYHDRQINVFADSPADLVTALTIPYVDEAIGIIRAAERHAMPVAMSFTVETNGKLPSGETLEQAITRCDAETSAYAAYYMINCAHPTHFATTLAEGGPWLNRLRGVRANASKLSHAELDESTELDEGNPAELGTDLKAIASKVPNLSLFGGCCGTDHRHIEHIAREVTRSSEPQAVLA